MNNVRIGDVVMYVPRCAGDRAECVHEPIHHRAAIVNHLNDDNTVGLTVFHLHSVALLSPVQYSANREFGTWHFRDNNPQAVTG